MARRSVDASRLPTECYTVPEFCAAHRFGMTKYYEMRDAGRGPEEIRIGNKPLITRESAARWRAARDAEAKQTDD